MAGTLLKKLKEKLRSRQEIPPEDATKLRMPRIRSFIFRERLGGHGGKERAIGPFFPSVAVLCGPKKEKMLIFEVVDFFIKRVGIFIDGFIEFVHSRHELARNADYIFIYF